MDPPCALHHLRSGGGSKPSNRSLRTPQHLITNNIWQPKPITCICILSSLLYHLEMCYFRLCQLSIAHFMVDNLCSSSRHWLVSSGREGFYPRSAAWRGRANGREPRRLGGGGGLFAHWPHPTNSHSIESPLIVPAPFPVRLRSYKFNSPRRWLTVAAFGLSSRHNDHSHRTTDQLW